MTREVSEGELSRSAKFGGGGKKETPSLGKNKERRKSLFPEKAGGSRRNFGGTGKK